VERSSVREETIKLITLRALSQLVSKYEGELVGPSKGGYLEVTLDSEKEAKRFKKDVTRQFEELEVKGINGEGNSWVVKLKY
jgi:hypothetical protein